MAIPAGSLVFPLLVIRETVASPGFYTIARHLRLLLAVIRHDLSALASALDCSKLIANEAPCGLRQPRRLKYFHSPRPTGSPKGTRLAQSRIEGPGLSTNPAGGQVKASVRPRKSLLLAAAGMASGLLVGGR